MLERTIKDICFCPKRIGIANIFHVMSLIVTLLSRGLEVNGASGANKNLTLEKDPIAVIGKNLTIVWLSKSEKLPNLITFSVEIGGTKPRRQNLWKIEIESKSKPVKYTRIKGLSPPFDVFTGQTEVKHSDKRYELLLINVRSNMNITNYTFVCEVQLDVFNTIERTVKVKLAVKPVIKSVLNSEYVYMKGARRTLACEADGLPVPEVQWLRHDEKVLKVLAKGNRTVNLDFDSVEKADAKMYTCRALNSAGSAEKLIHIKVKYLEVIPNVNSKIYKKIGEKLDLQCPIVGYPNPSYEWHMEGHRLVGGSKYYSVTTVEEKHFGNYTCKAFSSDMGEKAFDFVVSRSVIAVKNTSKASKPLKVGETLVLDCPVDGIPIPSYKWYKDTKEVATGKKYSIKIDGDKAFGIYICKASNEAGVKNSSFTVTRHIIVVKNTSKASKPLKIGETLVLDCPVDGIPIPSYKWYKDTKEVATGKKYSIKIDGDKAFGIYICKASNKAGVKNFSFTITRHKATGKGSVRSGSSDDLVSTILLICVTLLSYLSVRTCQ